MTFSDVFLPVPLVASPFDLHRLIVCCKRGASGQEKRSMHQIVQPDNLQLQALVSGEKKEPKLKLFYVAPIGAFFVPACPPLTAINGY